MRGEHDVLSELPEPLPKDRMASVGPMLDMRLPIQTERVGRVMIDRVPLWIRRLWCRWRGHPWVTLGKSPRKGEVTGLLYGCPRCGKMRTLESVKDDI